MTLATVVPTTSASHLSRFDQEPQTAAAWPGESPAAPAVAIDNRNQKNRNDQQNGDSEDRPVLKKLKYPQSALLTICDNGGLRRAYPGAVVVEISTLVSEC